MHAARVDRKEGRHRGWLDSSQRVAERLSQRMDEPPSLVEETKLRLHLSMCRDGHDDDAQMKGLRAASAASFPGELDMDAMPDDEAARGRPAAPGGSHGNA